MEVPLGDTFYFKFTTRQYSDGAPTQLAGTPVVDIYEENNLTQITGAETLTVDYDGITGLNDLAIVCTSANGFEVGKYYNAVITTGTVGGTSVVGEVVGPCFRIMPAEDAAAGVKDVNITHISDVANSTTTAQLGVNVVQISGDGPAADNLEADYDGTGYSKTASTINTVTNVTNDVGITATAVDNIWDEALSGHNTGGTAGKALNNAAALVVTDGTCQATGQTSTNVRLAAGESSTNDIYKNDEIIITGGTGAGESALITAYDGTNKDCTVSPALVITCDGTSTYEILPAHSHAEDIGATGQGQINTEVSDVIKTDTYTLPGQEAPPASPTLEEAVMWLYKMLRNKKEATSTTISLYDDAGTTVDAKRTISDNGTTYTEEEIVTGP